MYSATGKPASSLACPKEQCLTLRREAGRCWGAMVTAHRTSREMPNEPVWLSAPALEKLFKGGQFVLHSQTVQALAQKLEANVQTITELRRQQKQKNTTGKAIEEIAIVTARYPYRTPLYQTPIWKEQAIRVQGGQLSLSCGKGRTPLVLPLPAEYRKGCSICKAELLWRADHYQLALTIDTKLVNPAALPSATVAALQPDNAENSSSSSSSISTTTVAAKVAGGDLGEIHLIATTTESGESQIVSGRALRSVKQLRNKRHSELTAKLSRCIRGSRRWKKLTRRKCQASAKCYRQQRDILHKASRQTVQFCEEQAVKVLAVGDVRDIADEVNLGRHTNQKISQWAHGIFVAYLRYKLARIGISLWQIPEDYSSRTCSECNHLNPKAPKGRNFICAGCGACLHRDANGAANICSRAKYGSYGRVQCNPRITYLRPLAKPGVMPDQVVAAMIPPILTGDAGFGQ